MADNPALLFGSVYASMCTAVLLAVAAYSLWQECDTRQRILNELETAPLTDNTDQDEHVRHFNAEARDFETLKLGESSFRHLPSSSQSLRDTSTALSLELTISRGTTDRVERLFQGHSTHNIDEITHSIRKVRTSSLSKNSLRVITDTLHEEYESSADDSKENEFLPPANPTRPLKVINSGADDELMNDGEVVLRVGPAGKGRVAESDGAEDGVEEEKIVVNGKKYTLEELRAAYSNCCSFTMIWMKSSWRTKSIYLPVVVQIWDVASDFAVTWTYFETALAADPSRRLSMLAFAFFAVFVLLNYRVLSAASIYKLTNKYKLAAAQFADFLIYYEVYTSHSKKEITPNMRWIQKMQAILESAPQALMQIVFVMTNKNLSASVDVIVYVSLIWSVATVTTRLINDDGRVVFSDSWKKDPKFVRALFRLTEIFGRVCFIALVWIVLSWQAAFILFLAQLCALTMFFRNGMLGYEPWNVLGFLFAVSDIGIEQNYYMNPYLPEEICMCCCGCCFCFWATVCVDEKDPDAEYYYPRLTIQFVIARTIEQLSGMILLFTFFRPIARNPGNSEINIEGTYVVFLVGIICSILCPILLFIMIRLKDFNPHSSGQRNPFDLIKGNHLEEMYLLHVAGANLTEFTDNDKHSPLHYACHHGNPDITSFLIRIGCSPNAVDEEHNTPLHYACCNLMGTEAEQNYLCIHFLIKTKMSVTEMFDSPDDPNAIAADERVREFVNAPNNQGNTPFHLACGHGNEAAVRLLLDREGDLDAVNERGMSAIHFAAHSGDSRVVGILLDHGASVSAKDNTKLTPLHYAVIKGSSSVVRRLLRDRACNINARDAYGRTPFYSACDHCELDIALILVENGADREIPDNNNRKPVRFGAQYRELRVLFPNNQRQSTTIQTKARSGSTIGEKITAGVRGMLSPKIWASGETPKGQRGGVNISNGFPSIDSLATKIGLKKGSSVSETNSLHAFESTAKNQSLTVSNEIEKSKSEESHTYLATDDEDDEDEPMRMIHQVDSWTATLQTSSFDPTVSPGSRGNSPGP